MGDLRDNSAEEAMLNRTLNHSKVHSREDNGVSSDGDDTYKGASIHKK